MTLWDILYSYFRKHPFQFVVLFVGRMLLFFLEVVVLAMIASRIITASQPPTPTFQKWALLFTVVFMITSCIWFLIEALNSRVISSVQAYTREEIFRTTVDDSENEVVRDAHAGEVLTHLSRIPQLVYSQMVSLSFYVMPFFFTFFFVSIYLLCFDWRIGVLFLSVFVGCGIIYGWWFKKNMKLSKARYNTEVQLSKWFESTLLNSETIRNDDMGEEMQKRLQKEQETYSKALTKELMAVNWWKQTLDGILMITCGCMLLAGYSEYKKGRLNAVSFASMVTLIIFVINKMISLINRIGDMPTILVGMDMYQTTAPSSRCAPSPEIREDYFRDKRLTLSDVSFSYKTSSTNALHLVSIDMPFKSSHLILGQSGAGKTTLCRIIMGYMKHDGRITSDGINLRDIPKKIRRHNIAYMTQNGFLFEGSFRDNLRLTPSTMQKLQSLAIYPRIQGLLDRQVGFLGSSLSGGERQLVLLLRAYLRPGFFIILDEPTSNLDPSSVDLAKEVISLMMKDKTVLCISHDYSLVSMFHTVYLLEKGVLIPYDKP